MVALGGPTGAGKSSLFNALAGEDLTAVGRRRPTTSTAAAAVWSEDGDGGDGAASSTGSTFRDGTGSQSDELDGPGPARLARLRLGRTRAPGGGRPARRARRPRRLGRRPAEVRRCRLARRLRALARGLRRVDGRRPEPERSARPAGARGVPRRPGAAARGGRRRRRCRSSPSRPRPARAWQRYGPCSASASRHGRQRWRDWPRTSTSPPPVSPPRAGAVRRVCAARTATGC